VPLIFQALHIFLATAKALNMPKSFYEKLKKLGGAIRWRTITLPNGEYAHVAITRKAGPRGGRTLVGEIRERVKV
jgi:hypothetical protein